MTTMTIDSTDVPLVTVAIPTFRRAAFLPDAIDSVLSQTHERFRLLIIDNNDDSETADVVNRYKDPRLVYSKTPTTLSTIAAWNRCVECCSTPYLVILGDDDRLHPKFLERSVCALENHPSVGFSFAHANKTDKQWNVLRLWGYDFIKAGVSTGWEYLHFTLQHACCISLAPTVLVRMTVHNMIGGYQAMYAANTFDLNFYLRAATHFDTYFIDEVLVDYRLHDQQLTEEHWRTQSRPTGKIGTYLELIGLISQLQGVDASLLDRFFLQERLDYCTRELTALLRIAMPNL